MDTPLYVAVISASASILVAVLTFYLTKKKEREGEWRQQKIEHYRELLESLNDIVEGPLEITPEHHRRWAKSCNTIGLVAPQNVLEALWSYQEATSRSNEKRKPEDHDKYLNGLILEIRKDLGMRPVDNPERFRFRLWVSG